MWYNVGMNDESHNSGIMKYLVNEKDTEKFFHSSGYARETYHSNNISSQKHTADTFNARQELERKRQFVRGYKDARVIADARARKAVGDIQRARQISANNNASNNTARRMAPGNNSSGPATPPARRVSGISR